MHKWMRCKNNICVRFIVIDADMRYRIHNREKIWILISLWLIFTKWIHFIVQCFQALWMRSKCELRIEWYITHYTLCVPPRSPIRQKHKILHLYTQRNETMYFVCLILIVLRIACHVFYSAFSFSVSNRYVFPSFARKNNNRKMEINMWNGVNLEWVLR